MFKKLIWYFIITISTAGFVILSSGFYDALKVTDGGRISDSEKIVNTDNNPAKAPVISKQTNTIRILVLGDSVAKGTGDEKGKGFSTYLPDYFKNQTPRDIQLDNIAVDGLQSSGLLGQLKDNNTNALTSVSDIIVVSIGGNDLRRVRSTKAVSKDDEFKDKQDNYIGNLKDILKVLRKSNPEALIVFVGLYNPYGTENSYENTRLLNTWNYSTQQLIEEDILALFIPTYDIFKLNLKRYISPDGLHPNSAGYQAVSNRIVKSVEGFLNR